MGYRLLVQHPPDLLFSMRLRVGSFQIVVDLLSLLNYLTYQTAGVYQRQCGGLSIIVDTFTLIISGKFLVSQSITKRFYMKI